MPSRSVLTKATPLLLFATLAIGLLIPALRAPPMTYDSFWIDQVWSEQFTTALRAGDPYPRWLPLSFGGLGAPVFYFYAPLSFYVAGLFGLIGLATYPALLATFAAAWFASGVAMHAWLRGWTRRPVAGALLYMALPYHVIDFYGRGALAEFCAMALLPLVALATRHAIVASRSLPLAAVYAFLVLTHLPTAVLAGALLIAPQATWLARREPARLWAAARGVAGAIGGTALYLVPALTLQHHSSLGSLWSTPFLRAASWSILHPELWPNRSYVLLFAGMAGATAIAVTAVSWRRPAFWPLWTIAVGMVVVGLIPGFWSLPIVSAVQFPWRALALAEFGLATAVACYRGSPVVPVLATLPLLSFSFAMATPTNPLGYEPIPRLPVDGLQDVVEYLPAGAVDGQRRADTALVARAAEAAQETPGSAFPFPSLRALCPDGAVVAMRADPATHPAVAPPPGCTRTIVALPAERIGLAVSLLSWAYFALPWLRARRRRRAAAYPGISRLASP